MYKSTVHFLVLALNCISTAYASDANELLARYHDLIANVATNPFSAPLSVQSKDQGNVATAEVYGVFNHSYNEVANILGNVSAWCDFMPLSLNVKACTWQASPAILTLYIGKKEYQSPKQAGEIMRYAYSAVKNENTIKVELNAANDSTWTKSNIIMIEAMVVEEQKTIIHFASTVEMSSVVGTAVDTYLATLGRNRIGFSADSAGKPIKGVKGMVERNAMRYYLALQAYLKQHSLSKDNLFVRSAAYWFDLTEKYYAQLHELSREDYMSYKKHERYDQSALQKLIK